MMPIEECAGMLIMAASYARQVGTQVAQPFLAKWQLLWTQWAQLLLTQVPTPDTQLTTDDWAPTYLEPTCSTNLGLKAIIGLAAAAQIATILGDQTNAAAWSRAAQGNVAQWAQLSLDPSGNYLNLEQGATGTWSTIYNGFYEMVIGEVVNVHIDDAVIVNGMVDLARIRPIARLGYRGDYAVIDHLFEMPRV